MVNLTLTLDGSYIDKNRESAEKKAKKEFDDANEKDMQFELDSSVECVEINEETEQVMLNIDSPIGFMSVIWRPTTEDVSELLKILQTKIDKARTVIDNIKA